MIINSIYKEGPTQQDGRRYVSETHTDDQGNTYTYEWLGDQNAEAVLQLRSETLNKKLAEKAAALSLVEGTLLPLSKLEFRNLFGLKKQVIDAFNAQFESHPALNDAQKAAIRSGLNDFAESNYIARPFRSDVISLLGLYKALGLLTEQEFLSILEAGNG